VEGPDHRTFAGGLYSCGPLPHFTGGFVGEGDGKDGLGRHAPFSDQVGDLRRDDPGLSGAGSGEDEERRTLVEDGLELFRVEAGEIGRRRGG
jgi:hypothetical protein